MIRAVLLTLALRLWRDKGALAMAFLLPGAIFAIFAAIFNSASGGALELRVAAALAQPSSASQNLMSSLENDAALTLSTSDNWTPEDIRQRVALGQDDVGIVISGDIAATDGKITIYTEPSRKIAGDILGARIRAILAETAPEILIGEILTLSEQVTGPLTPAQQIRKNAALEIIKQTPLPDNSGLIAIEPASGTSHGPDDPSVSYYVGATIAMFLLFSAMHGAALALEERETGITERLLLGRRGAMQIMLGRFLYLTLQGLLQAAVIIAVAAIGFGVPVMAHLFPLVILSLLTAAACAALALLVATLARTPIQMNTFSTFIVLLFSAIGGSMVPRFMMPGWLQDLGWATPNAWIIEGFYDVLARQLGLSALAMPCLILGMMTVICLLLGSALSHKMMRY